MIPLAAGCLGLLLGCASEDVVGPPPRPIEVQANQQSETGLDPDADAYVSKTTGEHETNFGADTILKLGPERRTLLRWDSLTLAQAVGDDSLVAAELELAILSNDDAWGGTGRVVTVHPMSQDWPENDVTWKCPVAPQPPFSFCIEWAMADGTQFQEFEGNVGYMPWHPAATDSVVITNGQGGVVTFDVTGEVRSTLAGSWESLGSYSDGWLVKKADEGITGSVSFGSRESASSPRLLITTATIGGGQEVPVLPPDTLPSAAVRDSIYDPANITYDARIGWSVPRNIIFLTFQVDATQSERQQAIDFIQGEVIGGSRIGPEGTYIVRIPDDGTIEPLLSAIAALETLTQVMFVRPHPPGTVPSYPRPNDGVGWTTADWPVNDAEEGGGIVDVDPGVEPVSPEHGEEDGSRRSLPPLARKRDHRILDQPCQGSARLERVPLRGSVSATAPQRVSGETRRRFRREERMPIRS